MKDQKESRLLEEILADDSLVALRRASLDQGLDAMRRARRLRRTLRGGMLALIPLLLIIARTGNKPGQDLVSLPTIPERHQAQAVAGGEASGNKMISDAELFALFPGRSLALIGKPGQQEIVFLDAAANP